MQMQMGMGAGPNMAFDAPKAYKQERVNLRLHNHEYALEFAEKKLLGDEIPKKPSAASTSGASSQVTSAAASEKSSKFNKTHRRKH